MKDHPIYTDYQITNGGKVWSKQRIIMRSNGRCITIKGRWIKQLPSNKYGHLKVPIFKDKKRYYCYVHRLVLETFVGPCPKGMECRHKNSNAWDNNLSNLEWSTHIKNETDKIKNNRHIKGKRCGTSKLTNKQVKAIKQLLKKNILSQSKIAEMFNVSTSTIGFINTKHTWSHIK